MPKRLKHTWKLIQRYKKDYWITFEDKEGHTITSSRGYPKWCWHLSLRHLGRFTKILKIRIEDNDLIITLNRKRWIF